MYLYIYIWEKRKRFLREKCEAASTITRFAKISVSLQSLQRAIETRMNYIYINLRKLWVPVTDHRFDRSTTSCASSFEAIPPSPFFVILVTRAERNKRRRTNRQRSHGDDYLIAGNILSRRGILTLTSGFRYATLHVHEWTRANRRYGEGGLISRGYNRGGGRSRSFHWHEPSGSRHMFIGQLIHLLI